MRKAFDANVPKFRPRVKNASLSEEATGVDAPPPASEEKGAQEGSPVARASSEAPAAETSPVSGEMEEKANGVGEAEEAPLALSVAREETAGHAEGGESPVPLGSQPPLHSQLPLRQSGSVPVDGQETETPASEGRPVFTFDESPDVQARRERLQQVKRKVAAAARPAPAMPALPEAPAQAGESALALVRDLEAQLQRARDVEVALRADLDQARTELARGAAESRRTVERLAAVEQQVEEKRAVLQEMLVEMSALEEERDGAVGRAQALTALDEERQALLDGLSARAEQAEKGHAEAQAEVDRLGEDLDERATDAARLRSALAQVTRERDDLAREVAEARRERDELADARKALEQVHEALATARARLG